MLKPKDLLGERIEQLITADVHKALKISKDKYIKSIQEPSSEILRHGEKYDIALIDPRLTLRQIINRVGEEVSQLVTLGDDMGEIYKMPTKPYWAPINLEERNKDDSVTQSRRELSNGFRGLTLKEALFSCIEKLRKFKLEDYPDFNDGNGFLILGSAYITQWLGKSWPEGGVILEFPKYPAHNLSYISIGYAYTTSIFKIGEYTIPITNVNLEKKDSLKYLDEKVR